MERVASLETRARTAAAIAAAHADEVDAAGRFPQEAIDELGRLGLLAAAIPVELGGEGATMLELSQVATILGGACSSTGMIFAMHQIQVLSLTRHDSTSSGVRAVLDRVVRNGVLLASATTEIGIGGDSRSSGCFVPDSESFTFQKNAPVISYGRYATAILATARRTPDSPPSDQVLVVCPVDSTELVPTSEWNTLGFRGTCSPGFLLTSAVDRSHIVHDDFATISAQTMLPVSHILWASVWLGISRAATEKARKAVRAAARKSIGVTPPGAQRLAELLIELQSFADSVSGAARRFDDLRDDREALSAVSVAIAMNGLKIAASEWVVSLVGKALLITGISGYRLDSELTLGRQLRDAYGAALMVNNDRILANNAGLVAASRGEL
ncbi:acyl-CoA dehydrogenase family protein [soil metagenome]